MPIQKKALSAYRERLRRRGIVRLELKVRKGDVRLLRSVARALNDPAQEIRTRSLLKKEFGENGAVDLKALIESAPLDDVDLDRERDFGRDAVV